MGKWAAFSLNKDKHDYLVAKNSNEVYLCDPFKKCK